MKSLTLVLFWIALASCLFAQTEVIVKESKGNDKVVTVDVKKTGDAERTVTIVTDEDGEKNTIEWTDNGEIPEDVKKKLEAAGINISMLNGEEGNHIVVDVHRDVEFGDDDVHKEVIVIKKGDDGEVMEFEWDGEGEMPSKMKELMKEHNLEIEELHDSHDGKKMLKTKMRVHKDKMKKMQHREMKKGHGENNRKRKEYKIVTIDEEGNKKVNEWVGEDGLHEGHDEDGNVFIWKGGKEMHGEGNNFAFFSDGGEHSHLSNAYMGAHIESADGGARILEIIKDGPADKAGLQKGDIVQRVNGARARNMDGLLGILNYFDPADKVELIVLRDGNEKKLNITLGERPDSMK